MLYIIAFINCANVAVEMSTLLLYAHDCDWLTVMWSLIYCYMYVFVLYCVLESGFDTQRNALQHSLYINIRNTWNNRRNHRVETVYCSTVACHPAGICCQAKIGCPLRLYFVLFNSCQLWHLSNSQIVDATECWNGCSKINCINLCGNH